MRSRLVVFTLAVTLTGFAAHAKDPVQARKDLTSMGLSYNSTPQFFDALRNKDRIAIDLFLDANGVNLNARDPKTDKSAVRTAYDGKDVELTKRLLRMGAKPTSSDLEEALRHNDRAMFFDMLSAGADALTEKTLLGLLERKDRDLLQQTLRHVEPSKAAQMITPVLLAETLRFHKDLALIDEMLRKLGPGAKQMLDKPALRQQMNEYRFMTGLRTLTFLAAHYQKPDFDIVGLLVKHGADVNAIDPAVGGHVSGRMAGKLPLTPLFHSVWTLNEHAIKALLQHGADPNVLLVRQSGFMGFIKHQTVLSYAEDLRVSEKEDSRREDVVAILKNAGAKTPDELGAKDVTKTE